MELQAPHRIYDEVQERVFLGKRRSDRENIEAEICPDHVHMLVRIPPKASVSYFMRYLKEKSSIMLYEQFGE